MCGRYLLTSPADAIRQAFGFGNPPSNLAPRHNIAPTQAAPVIRLAAGVPEMVSLRWGLVPSWAKAVGPGAPLINARAETVAEKPAFRGPFRTRRCVVPADGFYEWTVGDVSGGKHAYCVRRRDRALLAFAGLWDEWSPGGGAEPVSSFAIVTTSANDALSFLHGRMPAILGPGDIGPWLAGPPEAALGLLRPAPGDWLEAYRVTDRVNRVANDGPDLLLPAAVGDAPPPARAGAVRDLFP